MMPSCVRYFLDIKRQSSDAVPVIGIYASSLDEAVGIYCRNVRSNLYSALKHCTHVMAEVNGIYIDSFDVKVPKGAIFYTEEVLILSSHVNSSAMNIV